MAKTIRQYAEDIKQASGTALGVYEMSLTITPAPQGASTPAPTPTQWVTSYLNALPNTALAAFGTLFQNTGEIAAFVIAVGPTLEQVAPAA